MRQRKVFLNVSSEFFLQIVTILCGIILPNMIIRNYGSEVNGFICSVSQFLGYIVILDSGIGNVIKVAFYEPLAQNDSYKVSLVFNKAISMFRKISYVLVIYGILLIVLFILMFKSSFSYAFIILMVIIIGITYFIQYFFGLTYQLLIQADQKGYIFSLIQCPCVILSTIISIILIKLNFSILLVKFVYVFFLVIRPILLYFYIKKHYQINRNVVDSNFEFKQKYDSIGHHISSIIHNSTDVVVLTLFSSNLSLISVYSVYELIIKSIKNIVLTFSSNIETTFGNMIAKNEYKNLHEKFNIYETSCLSITTFVFSITFSAILPFVKLYTNSITDINYIHPIFCFIFVMGALIYCYQVPYIKLVYSIGHFKQTKWSAYIEAMINVSLSIFLVNKFDLIGVAIGTTIAMLYRYFFHIYYVSKKILIRPYWESLKKVIINVMCLIISILIMNCFKIAITSYFEWIIYVIICSFISLLVIFIFNFICYNNVIVFYKKLFLDYFNRRKNEK